MKGLWTITRELPRLNRVGGGVIHVTDRSHKYNAGWYRDEFAPVRFVRAGFYITRRQSDKCKVVQRYAPLSEYFRRGAFILLMDMSDKSGWYRAGAPLHGCFPWRRFFIFRKRGNGYEMEQDDETGSSNCYGRGGSGKFDGLRNGKENICCHGGCQGG
ncbi:MAG: hypothetical protein ACLU3E_00620 [Dialister invisus]|uniref:hypothetical protein n=1 Tax=Dialister invisus TaxID=218538 RepID=UPI0027B8BB34|nr:hypothetical protein [Dialister invisus]